MQRDMTYSAPLKVTLRLIVFDVDEDTGQKSVKDIKEQDVFMGDMPLMTPNGTFIVNGTERVIVSQMHRSPGVFFDHDKGKTHSSGKLLFASRVIPYRGSWLDIEFDAKDIVYARIDRRRKIPATTLLMALGMDGEDILSHFYNTVTFKNDGKKGWRMPFEGDRLKGTKPVEDIVNADTGKVVIEAGKKVTARTIRDLDGKVKDIPVQWRYYQRCFPRGKLGAVSTVRKCGLLGSCAQIQLWTTSTSSNSYKQCCLSTSLRASFGCCRRQGSRNGPARIFLLQYQQCAVGSQYQCYNDQFGA